MACLVQWAIMNRVRRFILGRITKKTHTTSLDLTFLLQRSYFFPYLFSGCQGAIKFRLWVARASTRMSRRHMPYEKDMPRPCNPTSVFLQCYVFNARSVGPGWRGLEGGWLGLGKNVACFLKSWVSQFWSHLAPKKIMGKCCEAAGVWLRCN